MNQHVFEPYLFDHNNIIQVQEAGRRIAHFIGIDGLVFIISKSCKEPGRGGQIELDKSREVFIEIIPGTGSNTILTILAHEISHKFLQIHFILPTPGMQVDLEYEILTDITAVFLGLGKLMLEGQLEVKETSEIVSVNQVKKTTTQRRFGYLSPEETTFAYVFISMMRGLPTSSYRNGLSTTPMGLVTDVEKRHSDHLKLCARMTISWALGWIYWRWR